MWSLICRAARTLRPKHLPGSRSSDPSCTRHYHTSVVAPQTGASTGLYGFDHLKSPKGFQRFVDDAIERSGELVAYISSMPSSAEIIRAMDEISDTVCSVVDSAELCRNTHPDREFTEEANKAAMRINEYLHVRIQAQVRKWRIYKLQFSIMLYYIWLHEIISWVVSLSVEIHARMSRTLHLSNVGAIPLLAARFHIVRGHKGKPFLFFCCETPQSYIPFHYNPTQVYP